jgi:hypothetical protein
MGFLRKTVKLSTMGLAPIHSNSKKERAAKAAEKQVRIQRKMLRAERSGAYSSHRTVTAVEKASERVDDEASFRGKVVVPGTWADVKARREAAERDASEAGDHKEPSGSLSPVSAIPLGVADELVKLAALREKGIINEAEFIAQKARLLGS